MRYELLIFLYKMDYPNYEHNVINMNKAQLIDTVTKNTGLTKPDCKKSLDSGSQKPKK
jgi:hypothetical protein